MLIFFPQVLAMENLMWGGCERPHFPWACLGATGAQHHSGSARLGHLPLSSAAFLLNREFFFPVPSLVTVEQDIRCILGAKDMCVIFFLPFIIFSVSTRCAREAVSCASTASLR